MITICVDAFGGDNAPLAVLQGAVTALNEFGDIAITLCGDADIMQKHLSALSYDATRVNIVDAKQVITLEEAPVAAIRKKTDSSLVKALEEVAQKRAGAVVCAGSTGALLAGATFIVKRIAGIKRPALAPVLPTLGSNPVMLIDCGANVDCKSEFLHQFGIMGKAYMQAIFHVQTPRIGLLNIGAEAEKGDELRKQTYTLLSEDKNLRFVGNCEARDMLSGAFDVVVADGFSGNIALKQAEGTSMTLFQMLKIELMKDGKSKMGAMLAKDAFKRVKNRMDYTEYGGAMLLGVQGGVIKTHGSADARAFYSAIRQAREFILGNVVQSTQNAIANTEL